MTDYLLVTGDREALGWALSEQRMAFHGFQRGEARALAAAQEPRPLAEVLGPYARWWWATAAR